MAKRDSIILGTDISQNQPRYFLLQLIIINFVNFRLELVNSDLVVAFYDSDTGTYNAVDYAVTSRSEVNIFIVGAFWLSNWLKTGLIFLAFDCLEQVFYQSDIMKIIPIIISLLIQNALFVFIQFFHVTIQ